MQRPPPHSHEPCPLFFRIQEIIWCCCKRLSVKKKKNKRKQQVVCETLCTSPLWTKKKKYHRLTKSSQMPFSLVWFLNVFLMQHYISVVSEERTTMHIYDPCASFFVSFVAARLEKYASFRLFIFSYSVYSHFRRTETFRQTFIFWIFLVYLCRDHSMWQSLKVLAARHASHSFKLTGLLLGGRYYCRWLEDVPLRSE